MYNILPKFNFNYNSLIGVSLSICVNYIDKIIFFHIYIKPVYVYVYMLLVNY